MDIGATPQFEAPTIADLCRRLGERPVWAAEDPLSVDREIFERALAEMTAIQQRRGFPVARAQMVGENFMLRGVPVVVSE